MTKLRSVVFAALLAVAGGHSAHAQDTASGAGWVEWGSNTLEQALETVASPFQQAWVMAWAAIGGAEEEIAAEKAKFAARLQENLSSFSRDVARTGFEITSIGISPELIPRIILELELKSSLSEAAETSLRAEFDNPEKYGLIERTILLGLLDLDSTAESMKVEGYRFSGVELELIAIFPEVTLNFTREEDPAAAPEAPKTPDGGNTVQTN
jgi:hypothetical protein